MKRSLSKCIFALIIPLALLGNNAFAEEGAQDDVSKALDSTATQWSFQFAYQAMPNYKDDYVDGKRRPEGSTDFIQVRIVAPLSFDGDAAAAPLLKIEYAAIPEPSTIALAGLGLVAILGYGRRRRR